MQRGRKSVSALVATVAVDGRPLALRPPPSLSDAERLVFVNTVTAVKPGHLQPSDMPLIVRYVQTVAMGDVAAKKLAADIRGGRPSPHWLSTVERLQKLLIPLCRQLKLSPLSRSPNKSGHPQAVDLNGNGHVSAYEMMRLADEEA